jgi:thioredoxin reductase
MEFQDKRILVVGGGNAGAEVAQALADAALRNIVSYSFRETALSRPSRENVEKVAKLQTQKLLKVYPGTQVREIAPGRVVLEPGGRPPASVASGALSSTTLELENDFVFAMLGAKPPPFIKQVGIRMIRRGRPS